MLNHALVVEIKSKSDLVMVGSLLNALNERWGTCFRSMEDLREYGREMRSRNDQNKLP